MHTLFSIYSSNSVFGQIIITSFLLSAFPPSFCKWRFTYLDTHYPLLLSISPLSVLFRFRSSCFKVCLFLANASAKDDDTLSVAGTVFNEPWDSNVWENLLDLAQYGDDKPPGNTHADATINSCLGIWLAGYIKVELLWCKKYYFGNLVLFSCPSEKLICCLSFF